jgi:Spy/CpxP family protein refolding chaperone
MAANSHPCSNRLRVYFFNSTYQKPIIDGEQRMNDRRGISIWHVVLTVIAIVALSLQQVAQAQGMRRTPEGRAKILKDSLSLSDEQTSKITKIYEAQQKEMMEKMGELQGDRDAMRQLMQEVMTKTNKQIEALLTKDQLKKFQELVKQQMQMRGRMQQRRQGS